LRLAEQLFIDFQPQLFLTYYQKSITPTRSISYKMMFFFVLTQLGAAVIR